MGAVALLRAGCSHRQLPLSDVKYRGARHPCLRGAGHLRIFVYQPWRRARLLAALSAYRRSRLIGARGLSALYANLHRVKSETIRRAHAMHLTGIHRLTGVTVRGHHLTSG